MEAEERGNGIESGCMGSWGRAGNTPVLGVFSKKELEVIPLVSSSTENLKDHWWEETCSFKAGPRDDTVDYLRSLSMGSRDQALMEANQKV